MKRILVQASIFLGLLLIFTAINLPYDMWGDDLADSLRDASRRNGIVLDIERLRVGFPARFHATNVGLGFITNEGFPLGLIFFNEVHATPRALPLFLLNLAATANLEGDFGSIAVDLKRNLLGGDIEIEANGDSLSLAGHPLLGSLGIGGKLSVSFHLAVQPKDNASLFLDTMHADLIIMDGNYRGGHSIGGLFVLPEIRNLDARVSAVGKSNRIEIKAASITSSLGAASGEGSLSLSGMGTLDQGQFALSLDLSRAGMESFGGYLALAAGEPVDSEISHWDVEISFKEGRSPITTVRAR